MDLTGARVLVTGSNRGIGRAIAETLAREPLEVLLCAMRAPARFEPIAGGAAREIRAVRLDLGSREAIEESCEELGEDLRELDVLVNNAGLVTGGLLEEQVRVAYFDMCQVNLVGFI